MTPVFLTFARAWLNTFLMHEDPKFGYLGKKVHNFPFALVDVKRRVFNSETGLDCNPKQMWDFL
jgi:hypothetical protein